NKDDLGKADRQDDFRPNKSLPAGWYQVSKKSYAGTGFDKGHMCNSKDRTSTPEDNSATFLMTNMVPQSPNNNQKAWERLESYCRDLATQGKELYIVCGPAG